MIGDLRVVSIFSQDTRPLIFTLVTGRRLLAARESVTVRIFPRAPRSNVIELIIYLNKDTVASKRKLTVWIRYTELVLDFSPSWIDNVVQKVWFPLSPAGIR